mmetsp:Transcript_10769/g.31163  ORF Transcript_10769/g.31163 Transcript_10769/m.31163 type:complete len:403 (-) Transcript_10769:96-1304(-)
MSISSPMFEQRRSQLQDALTNKTSLLQRTYSVDADTPVLARLSALKLPPYELATGRLSGEDLPTAPPGMPSSVETSDGGGDEGAPGTKDAPAGGMSKDVKRPSPAAASSPLSSSTFLSGPLLLPVWMWGLIVAILTTASVFIASYVVKRQRRRNKRGSRDISDTDSCSTEMASVILSRAPSELGGGITPFTPARGSDAPTPSLGTGTHTAKEGKTPVGFLQHTAACPYMNGDLGFHPVVDGVCPCYFEEGGERETPNTNRSRSTFSFCGHTPRIPASLNNEDISTMTDGHLRTTLASVFGVTSSSNLTNAPSTASEAERGGASATSSGSGGQQPQQPQQQRAQAPRKADRSPFFGGGGGGRYEGAEVMSLPPVVQVPVQHVSTTEVYRGQPDTLRMNAVRMV